MTLPQFPKQDSAFSRRDPPEVCKNHPPKENRGRRECRVPNAPAASRANEKSTRDSHHRFTGTTRHSPRNGFTAYFALSSVTTLFDTVAGASYRRLDANDWGVGTTRLGRPRQHHSSRALPASTASRPAFVTIAIRPSCRNETVRISELIWVKGKQKYFCKRGLTRFLKIRSDLPVGLICHSRMQKFDLPWRQISKQQDVPATAVSIIVAIRLPCRRCSPNGFTRSPERHTEGR